MKNIIIESKIDITTDSLNTIFHGKLGRNSISRIEVNNLGTGQMSEAYRVELEYSKSNTDNLPCSVIIKVQSEDESSRRIGRSGFYLREIKFYQEYSERLQGIVPKCFYAEIDEITQCFTLVLQDMKPSQQGDQLTGCTLAEANSIIEAMARAHSVTWGDLSLDNHYWLADTTSSKNKDWIYNLNKDLFADRWKQFCTRFNDKLNADDIIIGDKLTDNFEKYLNGTKSEKCLVHGDLRSDNLLFNDQNESTTTTVVDWQVVGYAPGAKDLAYFLGTSIPTEIRQKNEDKFLELYLSILQANGVSGYTIDQLRLDYRFFSFSGFVMAVAASMEVEQTERGDEMFMKMFSLPCQLIRDSDALSLLK